jgi:hypothetical protein
MGEVEDETGGGRYGDGDFIGVELVAVEGDEAVDAEVRVCDEGSEGAVEADGLASESIDAVLDG